ncbi:Adenylate cyclase [hydrothermal vent metagenome]|uniref:adenylate cyclase n=1 Tax=hydrothermal vent metagenome TaxID=652676 RepID=A0A1W1CDP6_9ZZZZ
MMSKKVKLFHKISIKSKFLMMILGIAIFCIAIVGYQGLIHGKESLTISMYNHLTSLKSAKIQQVENYFQDKQNLLKTFSSQKNIIDAMHEFSSAYTLLDIYDIHIDKNNSSKLEKFYQHSYIKTLNANSIKSYSYKTMLPIKNVSKYLQYHYIVNNPFKLGSKDLLEIADDNSYYSEVHQKFHYTLKEIVKNQGFYDLFLIDIKNMNIVYSVNKEVDFATSLKSGAYGHSSLAKIVKKIIDNPNRGAVLISDFKNYKPSYNHPQAFFAIPIYDNNTLIGILATQISIKYINKITTGEHSWKKEGLGESGEVYLVGRDYKMRSDSRGILQNPQEYIKELNSTDLDENSKTLIKATKSTILNQNVHSESVKLAIEGKSGSTITKNYLNKEVISSYSPLNIQNIDWVIIAEKEIEEAEKPIKALQNTLLVSSTILATLITFYSIWLAYIFLRPITTMTQGLKKVINKESNSRIALERDDEFGELSKNINKIIDTINAQEEELTKCSTEKNALLLNILPNNIASRFTKGEKYIAEKVENVAVLFSQLYGFDAFSESMEAEESIVLLNEIINTFDTLALDYGIEKITTIGDSYMAANGLIAPRLDYARRMVEFALKMFNSIEEFNTRHQTNLQLGVGIDSGEVMAGVVGEYKFVYDIWGEIVSDASHISHEAEAGTLRISAVVYKQLIDTDNFQKCEGGSELTYKITPKQSND